MAIQGGLAILAAMFVFPESVGHAFQGKLVAVLQPLDTALLSIDELFDAAGKVEVSTLPPSSDVDTTQHLAERLEYWADKSKAIRALLLKSLSGIPPLKAQQRYLKVDFSYSRLSGHDLRELFDRLAVLQARSGGIALFFDIIVNNARHSHLDSSAFRVQQAAASQPGSRPLSFAELTGSQQRASLDGGGSDAGNTHSSHDLLHRRTESHLAISRRMVREQPVGVYESQRYMDVERALDE